MACLFLAAATYQLGGRTSLPLPREQLLVDLDEGFDELLVEDDAGGVLAMVDTVVMMENRDGNTKNSNHKKCFYSTMAKK